MAEDPMIFTEPPPEETYENRKQTSFDDGHVCNYEYYPPKSQIELLHESIEELISNQHRSNSFHQMSIPEELPPINELSGHLNWKNETHTINESKHVDIEEFKMNQHEDSEIFNKDDHSISLFEHM